MIKTLFTISFILLSISSAIAQNGIVRSYYSKGIIQSEISYIDEILDGTSFRYYQNGNLMEEKNYEKGKQKGWVREYYENGLVKTEYYIDDGIIDGFYKSFYHSGSLKELRNYSFGKLVSRSEFANDPGYVPSINEFKGTKKQYELRMKRESFLCDIDICAEPIGGLDAVQRLIAYPEHARLYGLEGSVLVTATVDREGNVLKTEIVRGIGLGCDEAAEEAVKKVRFLPGINKEVPVHSQVTFRVEFRLSGAAKLAAVDYKKLNGNEPAITESSDNNTGVQAEKPIKNFECDADICPEPVGGLKSIIDKIRIPEKFRPSDPRAHVKISAQIDEYGNVLNTDVLEGINATINNAAEMAILETEFKPALKKGIAVDASVIIIVPLIKD